MESFLSKVSTENDHCVMFFSLFGQIIIIFTMIIIFRIQLLRKETYFQVRSC